MNSIDPSNGPGSGHSHSGNGANHNPILADLIGAIHVGAARLRDDIRAKALALPLAAFISVAGYAKTAWVRRTRSQSAAAKEMSRLRAISRHCPGFSTIAVGSLTPDDIRVMWNLLDVAPNRVTGQIYKTSTFNAILGALVRLLETLAAPPLCLIEKSTLEQMRDMIEFGTVPRAAKRIISTSAPPIGPHFKVGKSTPKLVDADENKLREFVEIILQSPADIRSRCVNFIELLGERCRDHDHGNIRLLTALPGEHRPNGSNRDAGTGE